MFPRRALFALALGPCLLLNGCCTMARLFCGPDDSRWVSIAFDSPTAAVSTLLEAIRRDAPDVVYACMAAEWKRRHDLGSVEAQIAWQQLKRQVPGLHLAGYAQIPAPARLADDGATFELDVEGRKLTVDLVRESFRELVYRRPNGTRGEAREQLASWNTWAGVEPIDDPDYDRSRLLLEPIEFEHEGLDSVPLATIERAGLVRLWKVSDLRMPE